MKHLTLVATLLSGCSWISVKPLAKDYTPPAVPECTSESWAPAVDVGIAGLGALSVLGGLTVPPQGESGQQPAGIGGGLVLVGVGVASAWYGYSALHACKPVKDKALAQAKAAEERFIAGAKAQPIEFRSVRFVNRYAESILEADVLVTTTNEIFPALSRRRFDTGEQVEVKVTTRHAQSAILRVKSISLGQHYNLPPVPLDRVDPTDTLIVEYVWDAALGRFNLKLSTVN